MIRTTRPTQSPTSRRRSTRVATLVTSAALLAGTAVACGGDEADVAPTTTMAAGGEPVETTTTTLPPYEAPIGDIIGEALVAGQFTTLAGLLVEAGLVDALRDPGPFTVFAPTDDAFLAVPAATLDAVFADKDLMTAVLTYHVVAGESLNLADMASGSTLTTLQGTTLTITKAGDKTFVNGIEVVVGDVPATNGVIHVIGGVLVPNS